MELVLSWRSAPGSCPRDTFLPTQTVYWGKVEPAGGNKVRQLIALRRGLNDELAKKISKLIREEFPKVKPQIQGDAVRVSAKSKDDLQKVITRLRELEDVPVPLQFENYR